MIKPRFKQMFKYVGIAIVVLTAVIQFIPSSFDRVNPPVTGEPAWDSPDTRTMFMTACRDCHSNETQYPWYSRIAPASWMIESDIRNGRRHFNISEWDRSQRGGEDAATEVQRGSMPVGPYLLMHPSANFTAEQKIRFVDGLKKTFGGGSGTEEREQEEHE